MFTHSVLCPFYVKKVSLFLHSSFNITVVAGLFIIFSVHVVIVSSIIVCLVTRKCLEYDDTYEIFSIKMEQITQRQITNSRRRSLPWTNISNVLDRLLYAGFHKIGIVVFICIVGFKTICITKPTSMLNSSCSTVATE